MRRNSMRITTKGQVTIPIEIRKKLGLLPNSEVEFEIVGNAVRIRKVRGVKVGRSRGRIGQTRGRFRVR